MNSLQHKWSLHAWIPILSVYYIICCFAEKKCVLKNDLIRKWCYDKSIHIGLFLQVSKLVNSVPPLIFVVWLAYILIWSVSMLDNWPVWCHSQSDLRINLYHSRKKLLLILGSCGFAGRYPANQLCRHNNKMLCQKIVGLFASFWKLHHRHAQSSY